MELHAILVVALFVLAFAAVSRRVESSWLTPPIVFVAFGLVVGPYGLRICQLQTEDSAVHLLAELTLVLVLFTDASRIGFRQLKGFYQLPLRMLAIGLPLAIVFGAGAGYMLFPQLGLVQAALLASILAPTDAALGQAVVTSPDVPVRVRQSLNVESGLNDGFALPAVLILAAMAGAGEGEEHHWVRFVALQLILGPAIGAGVAWIGGQILTFAERRGWVTENFDRLGGLAIAFSAFAGAEAVGGNGFIAAFVAGMTMGNTARGACACLWSFAESEGQLLVLLSFLLFGAVMVWPALSEIDAAVVIYALLSLLLVRGLAISLSLLGTGLRWPSHLFLGWFGPRGLASIVFALLILEQEAIPGREKIFAVAMVVVSISVVLHGVSAGPAARAYGRFVERLRDQRVRPLTECEPAADLPLRIKGSVHSEPDSHDA